MTKKQRSLQDDLRITSGMMQMGERIPYGKDLALMDEAADLIDTLIEVADLAIRVDSSEDMTALFDMATRAIARSQRSRCEH